MAPWSQLAVGGISSNGDLLFNIEGLVPQSYRAYVLSLAWQGFSGISSQLIAADVFRDGNYQRISSEELIPVYAEQTRVTGHSQFAILDFEGATSGEGRLQFAIRRLQPAGGPILVNAIIIHPYR